MNYGRRKSGVFFQDLVKEGRYNQNSVHNILNELFEDREGGYDEKGKIWTPDEDAMAMIAWHAVIPRRGPTILEPAATQLIKRRANAIATRLWKICVYYQQLVNGEMKRQPPNCDLGTIRNDMEWALTDFWCVAFAYGPQGVKYNANSFEYLARILGRQIDGDNGIAAKINPWLIHRSGFALQSDNKVIEETAMKLVARERRWKSSASGIAQYLLEKYRKEQDG